MSDKRETAGKWRTAGGAAAALFLIAANNASADVKISSGATSNMTCANGVCAPTAADAVLNAGDLETLLASGNVKITTKSTGVQANNIAIDAPFSWSGGSALTLDAYDSIAVAQSVSVGGQGGFSLITNDGGSGGTLFFGAGGNVGFQNTASALTINGIAFELVDSISALAAAVEKNPGGSFALANAYDASQDGTYSEAPVATTLTGTVNGLGNVISNLSIYNVSKDSGGNYGLFAEAGGTIASLKMTGVNFTLRARRTGGGAAGGLVGLNEATLFNDSASGAISSNPLAAGGLAGANSDKIIDSFATVNIEASNEDLSHAGGLVGDNNGSIVGSYATGTVTGATAGGLVGFDQDLGTISNSYATGSAIWKKGGFYIRVGGLIGVDDSGIDKAIKYSYSTGLVKAFNGEIGGFIGEFTSYSVLDCYWDTTTSHTDNGVDNGNISGVTGLTSMQLKSGLPAGFDPTIWAEDKKINGGFPYLIANPPAK